MKHFTPGLIFVAILGFVSATGAPITAPVATVAVRSSTVPSGSAGQSAGTQAMSAAIAEIPVGLDLYLPSPPGNPITAAKVELGRMLFFETRVSADGATSCATCHEPARAFTDGRRVPTGVYGRQGQRNAPSLVNRAYGDRFFWDGRAATLEDQVADAQAGTADLGLPPEAAARRLRGNPVYEAAFTAAFVVPLSAADNTSTAARRHADTLRAQSSITGARLVQALATFVRVQLSADSLADRFDAGDRLALTPAARRGRDLFYGSAACGRCHSGPLLSDEGFHNTGVSWGSDDLGRAGVTGNPEDRGRFKTPSLRNVALTAPYMHDGSIATLEEVIDFYAGGANPNPNLDEAIRPLGLDPPDKEALVVFLESVTGARRASIRPLR